MNKIFDEWLEILQKKGVVVHKFKGPLSRTHEAYVLELIVPYEHAVKDNDARRNLVKEITSHWPYSLVMFGDVIAGFSQRIYVVFGAWPKK